MPFQGIARSDGDVENTLSIIDIRYIDRYNYRMTSVTVSPKFQIVIPKDVRKAAKLHAGTKCTVFYVDGRIEVIPLRPIQELRGIAKGMDTTIEREPDRF